MYDSLHTTAQKTTIDSQILLEECSFMIHHFLWKSSIIFMPDFRCQTWRFKWSLLLNGWVNRFTHLEGVLLTDPPDPKPRHPGHPGTIWWFYTCRWSSVESHEGWGPLDITDQTLPKDIPCICSLSPTVWDMRHEDQDPGQNTRLSRLSQEVFKHLFPKPDSRPT